MQVDYVVVAYRSDRHLASCLDAIEADRPDGALIIVVDNASPDASRAIAEEHPSHPRLIRLPENVGFGAGCNAGVAASDAEAIFFVNPDARLERGCTSVLLRALDADRRLAVAGPRVVHPRGEVLASAGGAEPSLRAVLGHYLRFADLPVVGTAFPPLHLVDPLVPARPDWLTGAAMLIRRTAFSQVGGFDARLFLYMEDVDLCRRLRAKGWQIGYVPAARAVHEIGGSQDGGQPARWYRAFHRYLVLNRGPLEARVASLLASLGFLARSIAQRRSRPANARRMAIAARVAALSAIGPAANRGDRV
jgi:GT2 family glycosyltransferase